MCCQFGSEFNLNTQFKDFPIKELSGENSKCEVPLHLALQMLLSTPLLRKDGADLQQVQSRLVSGHFECRASLI